MLIEDVVFVVKGVLCGSVSVSKCAFPSIINKPDLDRNSTWFDHVKVKQSKAFVFNVYNMHGPYILKSGQNGNV